MRKFSFVILMALGCGWPGVTSGLGAGQSTSDPVPRAAEQEAQKQEPSGSKTPKPGTAVPFEDQGKSRADIPPPVETNNLATLDRSTVIAEVNGQPVTMGDLSRLIEYGDERLIDELSNDAAKKELLKNYLTNRAFYFEGLAEKVDEEPDLKGRLELVRQQMIANAYLAGERKKLSVTEDELRKYYEDHKKEFEVPENVNVSHILVRTDEEAREIKKELDAGGDFAEVASRKSLDTTNKNNGGNLGWIARGAMLPAFEDAAFRLKPGQISDPVYTSFGYHLIKVLQVRPRAVRPFNEARNTIAARVQVQKQSDWMTNKTDELLSKYKVKIQERYFVAPVPPPADANPTPPTGLGTKP